MIIFTFLVLNLFNIDIESKIQEISFIYFYISSIIIILLFYISNKYEYSI